MHNRLINFWESLRASYWFVPSIMTGASAALAFVMVELDHSRGVARAADAVLPGYGAEGARAVLSTIAGSAITVAGTVFSITIVALTLASTQFGPRLLRNFMTDLGNQIVLGTFTATFLYSLLILRTVNGRDDATFVPHASVVVAVALAVLSVGVLIYFIHHVSVSIQASTIIANVARELLAQIDRLFPEGVGQEGPADPGAGPARVPPGLGEGAALVAARESGYVRALDQAALLRLADEHDIVVRLRRHPGAFAASGAALASVWPGARLTDSLAERIRGAFVIGHTRTPDQDAEFALNQLVEIALRALSPGINDPFTAMSCIDWLGVCLRTLARRPLPSPWRYGRDGRLRVVAEPVGFVHLLRGAFEPIRRSGRPHALVMLRLLDTLASIAPCLRREEDRRALLLEARRLRDEAPLERIDDPQRPLFDLALDAVERGAAGGAERDGAAELQRGGGFG